MNSPESSVTDRTLSILETITETDEVRRNSELKLFDNGVLDSLGMVELIVALSKEFGVDISPLEIERQDWETPHKICVYMEGRAGK